MQISSFNIVKSHAIYQSILIKVFPDDSACILEQTHFDFNYTDKGYDSYDNDHTVSQITNVCLSISLDPGLAKCRHL